MTLQVYVTHFVFPQMFLSRLVYPGIWLGLSDKGEEHVWKWIDEAPLEYS